MPMGILFWVLFVVGLIFGLGVITAPWAPIGGSILLFVLLGLLGWKVFGPALH